MLIKLQKLFSKKESSDNEAPSDVLQTDADLVKPKNNKSNLSYMSQVAIKALRTDKKIQIAAFMFVLLLMTGSVFAYNFALRDNNLDEADSAKNSTTNQTDCNSCSNESEEDNSDDSNTGNNSSGSDKSSGSGSTVPGDGNSSSSGSSGNQSNSEVNFVAPIGFVGGSLTNNAIDGYNMVGGVKFWSTAGNNFGGYGGGTVTHWAEGISAGNANQYWGSFNIKYTKSQLTGPTKYLWFELLSHGGESDETLYNNAVAVINEIKSRISGVQIYVSGMNGYNPTSACATVTPGTYEQMNELAGKLTDNGYAKLGPTMPKLTSDQLRDGSSGCHANDSGKTVLGNAVLNFFK